MAFRWPRLYVPESTAPSIRREPMPGPFEALAQYNSERARGLVHTPEWDARMAALQAEFDEWASGV
jgi:hypothetical protein